MVSLTEGSVDDQQSEELLRLMAPTYIVPDSVTISTVYSPVELRIYDSHGNVTGMIDGIPLEEIPNSICLDDTIVIFSPEDAYRYVLVGTQEGVYGFNVMSIGDGNVMEFSAFAIDILPSAVHQFHIDWDSLSEGGEGVTVQIDSDGDGVFERTVTADADFTAQDVETTLRSVGYRWGPPAPGYIWAQGPTLESWMNARIENVGPADAFNVAATITRVPSNVTIVDGQVSLGDISAGSSAWSTDTFRIKIDTSKPSDPNEGIFWRIEYDDAFGRYHVIENVPQFPSN